MSDDKVFQTRCLFLLADKSVTNNGMVDNSISEYFSSSSTVSPFPRVPVWKWYCRSTKGWQKNETSWLYGPLNRPILVIVETAQKLILILRALSVRWQQCCWCLDSTWKMNRGFNNTVSMTCTRFWSQINKKHTNWLTPVIIVFEVGYIKMAFWYSKRHRGF